MKIILILLSCICTIIFFCSSPAKVESGENQCIKYTCLMHPDETSAKPGACPECNMKMIIPGSIKIDSALIHAFYKKCQRINSGVAYTSF